ncbi:MAG: hypothetical protein P1V97_06970 [Planctomycetota bacterium]|nr:hypothetical protein [Planctomycetota bacterium]
MKHYAFSILCLSVFIATACGAPAKNGEGKDKPKPITTPPPKVIGIPEAKVQVMVNDVYVRGIGHGRGIAASSMLVSTRNFDVVWETTLQDLKQLPSLVPYLLGFLDTVNREVPQKVQEGRRAARAYVPKLNRSKEQVEEQIRDRCIHVLALLIPIAQDPNFNRNRIFPETIKTELRNAMDRELAVVSDGKRKRDILTVKNFVKPRENVEAVIKAFNQSLAKSDWQTLEATMKALVGVQDTRVQIALFNAFKKLYGSTGQPEPALCGALLRGAANISVDSEMLNLAASATDSVQPFDIRSAGIYCLGKFARRKGLQEKALQNLGNVLKKKGINNLRIEAAKALSNFRGGPGLTKLRECRVAVQSEKSSENVELIQAIDAAIVKVQKNS